MEVVLAVAQPAHAARVRAAQAGRLVGFIEFLERQGLGRRLHVGRRPGPAKKEGRRRREPRDREFGAGFQGGIEAAPRRQTVFGRRLEQQRRQGAEFLAGAHQERSRIDAAADGAPLGRDPRRGAVRTAPFLARHRSHGIGLNIELDLLLPQLLDVDAVAHEDFGRGRIGGGQEVRVGALHRDLGFEAVLAGALGGGRGWARAQGDGALARFGLPARGDDGAVGRGDEPANFVGAFRGVRERRADELAHGPRA